MKVLLVVLLICSRVLCEVTLDSFTRLVATVDSFEDKFIQSTSIQQQFSNISSLVRFQKRVTPTHDVLLQTVPVSEALLADIKNKMIMPRKKELVPLLGRRNKLLWVGYDLAYIQQVLRQLAQEQKWLYKAIECPDILRRLTHQDQENRIFTTNYFSNQMEISQEVDQPTLFYMNRAESILGESQSYYGRVLLNMAMRWLEGNIEHHQNNDHFILVMATDQPMDINEVVLQKLEMDTVFVSFLQQRSIKQLLVQEVQKAEQAMQQYQQQKSIYEVDQKSVYGNDETSFIEIEQTMMTNHTTNMTLNQQLAKARQEARLKAEAQKKQQSMIQKMIAKAEFWRGQKQLYDCIDGGVIRESQVIQKQTVQVYLKKDTRQEYSQDKEQEYTLKQEAEVQAMKGQYSCLQFKDNLDISIAQYLLEEQDRAGLVIQDIHDMVQQVFMQASRDTTHGDECIMNQERLRSVMTQYNRTITQQRAKVLKEWYQLHQLLKEQVKSLSYNITTRILDQERSNAAPFDLVHQFIQEVRNQAHAEPAQEHRFMKISVNSSTVDLAENAMSHGQYEQNQLQQMVTHDDLYYGKTLAAKILNIQKGLAQVNEKALQEQLKQEQQFQESVDMKQIRDVQREMTGQLEEAEDQVDIPVDPFKMRALESKDILARQDYDFEHMQMLMDQLQERKRKEKEKAEAEQRAKDLKKFNINAETITVGNFTFYKKDSDLNKPAPQIIKQNTTKTEIEKQQQELATKQKELLELQQQYQTLNQKKNSTKVVEQKIGVDTKNKAKANGYQASPVDDVFSKLTQLPGLDKNPKLQKLALLQQQKHEMLMRKQAKPIGFASLMNDIQL